MAKKAKDRIILGLDGSIACSGYAIFKNNKRLASGVIIPIGSQKYKQINSMVEQIQEICRQYEVTEFCIEDIQLQNNPVTRRPMLKTYKALAEFRGHLKTVLVAAGIKDKKIFEYAPATWRKVHKIKQGRGITREMLKEQAMNMLKDKIADVTIDEAEAILIAMAHIILTKR